MKARKFNTIMPKVNHEWAARVLGMRVNPQAGPDIIDADKAIELKFSLKNGPRGRYPLSWTVLEHQMDYSNGKTAYWGLGTYTLAYNVSEIKTTEQKELEKLVVARELYIVSWDWMRQYPPHQTEGQTQISRWQNTFRYPKLKDLPDVIETLDVSKGVIYLTDGVNRSDFD
jgi:hypothetical protein